MADREHAYLRLALDLAILTVRENSLQVLVIVRANEPFRGWTALPGGFLRKGERLRAGAERELREETGLSADALHLEEVSAFDDPGRDPRGQIVSMPYLAMAPDLPIPTAGSDAQSARWAPVDEVLGTLAFDHDDILKKAVEQARSRLEFTTLAAAFCQPAFTMSDLRHVYEVVWGVELDPRNFSRKVLSSPGFIEPTGDQRRQETGRPAVLYRRGSVEVLRPPLLRAEAVLVEHQDGLIGRP